MGKTQKLIMSLVYRNIELEEKLEKINKELGDEIDRLHTQLRDARENNAKVTFNKGPAPMMPIHPEEFEKVDEETDEETEAHVPMFDSLLEKLLLIADKHSCELSDSNKDLLHQTMDKQLFEEQDSSAETSISDKESDCIIFHGEKISFTDLDNKVEDWLTTLNKKCDELLSENALLKRKLSDLELAHNTLIEESVDYKNDSEGHIDNLNQTIEILKNDKETLLSHFELRKNYIVSNDLKPTCSVNSAR